MINSIALVGATHGNELSGIQLVKNWRQSGLPERFRPLNVNLLLANQAAMQANVRFVEQDLNRQFTPANLTSPADNLESHLAIGLNSQLGPKGNAHTDLVIDVHNTTSSMGATLIILQLDEFHIQLARFVKQAMPEANILVEDEKPYEEHGYLCTVGKRGVMIEVGAQPQGVLREDVYQLTLTMAEAILDFCVCRNQQSVPALPACEAFRLGENIHFPLDDNGERTAMIHHHLQDADFVPLMPGQPVFRSFDGSDINWWGDTPTYPHFINEAAYHKLHVAFATADLITL
ncbi:aspartoacylase [Alteromonas aestuariivivens]|uniref:Aspartoacylase n=1 Tax=Alteromonas aestuariivivens TaxID=1938339 RepID=A0A3D8ME11_9ALTE|nr:aspartoacylase [Alteromonas aestuariivivens]RDV29077.1 aspartoacylase [Alteromonas aestuariivivens]